MVAGRDQAQEYGAILAHNRATIIQGGDKSGLKQAN